MPHIEWRLAAILKARKTTALELARTLGVKHPTVYRLARETRFTRITEAKLRTICVALRCQPGDLLRLVDDDPRSRTTGQPALRKRRPPSP